MSIGTFVLAVLFWGIVLILINTFVPLPASMKRLLNIGVPVLIALWLLFSILHDVPDVTVTAK